MTYEYDVAIIIPAYNEELTIAQVIKDFYAELPNARIYVVDNNCTDRTRFIAEETFKSLSCKGQVILENRKGKAFAIRKAFTIIDADYYILVDGDSTYPANAVHKFLMHLSTRGLDMVVGNRSNYKSENKRAFHSIGNDLVNKLINLLFGGGLADVLSGYRGFSKRFVKNFPILSRGFDIETEMTLHALDKGFDIFEFPINYRDRPIGSVSKLNTYTDGIRVISLIFRIFKDFRPLAFFSCLSLALFIAGISAGTPVVYEYIYTGYVLHIPFAILATGLMICSLVGFAIGLILDTVRNNNRFNYGLHLISSQYIPKSNLANNTVNLNVVNRKIINYESENP
jgi:glycosyltransferase involved in cell wall biosynthesis